ncbi:hypothetical protein M9458_005408, partial [Cirrhinus mrigala]
SDPSTRGPVELPKDGVSSFCGESNVSFGAPEEDRMGLHPFLRFAFEGRAYQYKVLHFGLALSPHVFTKLREGALSPLWERGIRILNYLEDWLIIAHSRDLLCEHRDLVLRHLGHLGIQVNWEKSKLSPVQSISFLGMELDAVDMSAHLTDERVQSVLNCLNLFRHKTA